MKFMLDNLYLWNSGIICSILLNKVVFRNMIRTTEKNLAEQESDL